VLRAVRISPSALIVAAIALAGCGSGGGTSQVVVSAATSLKPALVDDPPPFSPGTVRVALAGSDQLAAQIRAGASPDVFAAANAKLPEALFAEGLVERPLAFARNELVLAVPAGASRIRGVADLARNGTTIAVGAPAVPVGSYTSKVLARLPATQRAAIRRNVRSEEPDVAGIVGKLTQGAVDAGFVYRTDVRAAGGRIRALTLPPALRPRVVYEAAVVRGTRHPKEARAYLAMLRGPAGQRALRRAGFLPPP
jgi:molybdate transport system substrate-binding protein